MSFADKITSLLARPSDNDPTGPDATGSPWYMKYAGRVLGIVAAFFAILFGLWNCFSILLLNFACVVSGVLQMLVGVVVMMVEAPVCCMFLEFAKTVSNTVDAKPLLQKAALYCIIAIPPVVICPGLGSLFGCGLVFATGVLYGMMAIGKKASAEEMQSAAAATDNKNMQYPTIPAGGYRSNLVNNAQPIALSGPPAFDSNV